jgi:hypothetical protein
MIVDPRFGTVVSVTALAGLLIAGTVFVWRQFGNEPTAKHKAQTP